MTKRPKKTENNTNLFFKSVLFCCDIASRIGISGFALVAIGFAIAKWSTPAQKIAIIDLYILLKWTDGSCKYLYPVIISVILVFFAQRLYYHNKYAKCIKEKDCEIDRMSKEKSKLQELLINQALNHSNS